MIKQQRVIPTKEQGLRSLCSFYLYRNGNESMARTFAKAFYNSKEWKTVREYCILRDHHACVYCGKPVEEVHHKIWLTPNNINDMNITLNPDNLICLCHDCHMKEHAGNIDDPYEFDENGMLKKKV